MNKIIRYIFAFTILLSTSEAKAVSISPPVIDISASPGNVIERSITINNETDKERTYSVGVMNFEMTGEEGYQKFIPAETENNLDLSGWIKYGEDKITVQPNSARKFTFTIDIPINADPGGHYASVYFSTGTSQAEENNNSVGIQAKINSLILLRVSGNVEEKAEIENFSLDGKNALLSNLPAKFIYRVSNLGNVHIKPKGNIEIKNIFGKRAVLLDANPKNNRVLPDNVRKIESQWGKDHEYSSKNPAKNFFEDVMYDFNNFALGRYTARLDVVYGKGNGNLITREITFWVFPWRALAISILAIAIALISAAILIKKYNRWIIKKHTRSAQ